MEITSDTDYKTRLDKKLVISKENPEPIFDLSECNIDKLPITFAFLKVLRKEILILGKNRLKSLASGGELKELELLKVLDLSHNKFKAIPAEICHLTNLTVSHTLKSQYI
jgi:E3 ubiquitin-protein ligase LRSAM1